MNENETQQLYQSIFGKDRIERWEKWKGDGNTQAGVRPGSTHPLAEIPQTSWTKLRWKTGITYFRGYRCVRIPRHPRATLGNGQYVFEHILLCEIAIGSFVPNGAVVHHMNEIKDDNTEGNLVVLDSLAHHVEIHRRIRAMKSCGNPDWHPCGICLQYDAKENLSSFGRHKTCHSKRERERYQSKVGLASS